MLGGQIVELLNVKHGGTYSDHWALKKQYRVKEQCKAVSLYAVKVHGGVEF
jgi:hypothetical protein